MAAWAQLDPAAEDLFERLRAFGPAELRAHVALGIGPGARVAIPAVSLTLRGALTVHRVADRLTLATDAPGEARLGRRLPRGGRPAYWQVYAEAGDGVVVSLTAAGEALTLEVRPRSAPHR